MIKYVFVLLMTLIAAFAGFFLKKSSGKGTILSIIKNKFLYIGGSLYVLAAVLNIWLLQRLPYSVVVPLGAVCYIWTLFIARKFLREKIGFRKIIGIVLILAGVVCIAL